MWSKNAFRSPIPASWDIWRMGPIFNSQILASAEIDYFSRQWVFIDHNIVWFEVTMQNAKIFIQVTHADQDLFHDDSDFILLV